MIKELKRITEIKKLGTIRKKPEEKTLSFKILSTLSGITNNQLSNMGCENAFGCVDGLKESWDKLYFLFDSENRQYQLSKNSESNIFKALFSSLIGIYRVDCYIDFKDKIEVKQYDLYEVSMGFMRLDMIYFWNGGYLQMSPDVKNMLISMHQKSYKSRYEHFEKWHEKIYDFNVMYYMFMESEYFNLRSKLAENLGMEEYLLPTNLVDPPNLEKETLHLF